MAKHEEKEEKRAKGGTVVEKASSEKGPRHEWAPGAPQNKEADNEKDSFKRGGRAKKKMSKDGGEKPEHRLDKRARGGRTSSPLTMASKVKGRPGGDYDDENGENSDSGRAPKLDKEDD